MCCAFLFCFILFLLFSWFSRHFSLLSLSPSMFMCVYACVYMYIYMCCCVSSLSRSHIVLRWVTNIIARFVCNNILMVDVALSRFHQQTMLCVCVRVYMCVNEWWWKNKQNHKLCVIFFFLFCSSLPHSLALYLYTMYVSVSGSLFFRAPFSYNIIITYPVKCLRQQQQQQQNCRKKALVAASVCVYWHIAVVCQSRHSCDVIMLNNENVI